MEINCLLLILLSLCPFSLSLNEEEYLKELDNKNEEIKLLKTENNYLKIQKENVDHSLNTKIDKLKSDKQHYKSLASKCENNLKSIEKEMEDRKSICENSSEKIKDYLFIIQSLTEEYKTLREKIEHELKIKFDNEKVKEIELIRQKLSGSVDKLVSQIKLEIMDSNLSQEISNEIISSENKENINQNNLKPLQQQEPIEHEKIETQVLSLNGKIIIEVYIPCKSKSDAEKSAAFYGGFGSCHTPVNYPIDNDSNYNPFPYFSLGRLDYNNEGLPSHFVANQNGIYYDYKFYYGENKDGLFARNSPGCDLPGPFYRNFQAYPSSNDYNHQKGTPKIKPTPIILTENRNQSKWNSYKNQMDVFVACKSREDAFNAALHHGSKGYYNTPIEDPINNENNALEFPHYHLGRNSKRQSVNNRNQRINYDYHYYYGVNGHGKIARQEEGCDKPVPYYSDSEYY